MEKQAYPPASLGKRLAAIVYDSLLLVTVLYFAGFIALAFTGGEPIEARNPLYTSYLFFVAFFYFAIPWVRSGQTLGMKTWRLRVQNENGQPISWWQALLRFLCACLSWACLGLGFIWSLFDKQRRTWHDRFSETVLIQLPKN